MSEERGQTARTLKLAVAAGLAMGLGYFAALWRLHGPIRSIDSGEAAWDVVRGPAMLLSVLSLGFGWSAAWIAARVWGVSGPLLWIPVGLAGTTALGVGFGVSAMAMPRVPGILWVVFSLWGGSIAAGALIRMKFDE